MANAVILQAIPKIYMQWSTSTNKRKKFKTYGMSNKELNALIEKKFQKFVKNKKSSENKIGKPI